MQANEPSIAGMVDASPNTNVPDHLERLAQLVTRLGNTPFTGEGKPEFEAAEQYLDSLPDETACPDMARCLLLLTRFRYFNGDAFSGLEPAQRAVSITERVQDDELLAKATNLFGGMLVETGNYPDAISVLSRALAAAKRTGDKMIEVAVLSNLGTAHQHAGQYGEAVACYERATEVADTEEDATPSSSQNPRRAINQAIPLANLALAYLHMRDIPKGLAAAERAIELMPNPGTSQERAIRATAECYYTRLLLEVRNIALASTRARFAREFAHGATDLAELFADMAQGLVEVHEPATRDIGLSRLQRVVNSSRKGTATALRDALGTIVRGYEVAGQPNAALVYLHEVAEINRNSRVRNVLRHHQRHLEIFNRKLHLDFAAQDALEQQEEELRFKRLSMDALRECMQVLEKNSVAAEMHDDETGEHCYRVGALAKELALRKGMDAEMCTLIDLSARLHDIGKLRVPDSILLKPGKFTSDERAIMEKHCEHGWELIGEGGLAQLFVAQEIALNHHERWDGSGYPNRRQGNMIPLAARVTALADVFDALTHRRCYKDAWSIEDAMREIAYLRGKHFDPELTDLFLALVPELQARHGDLDLYLGAEARKNDFIDGRRRIARELKADFGTFDVRR
jgi:putative two-component system response regulator